MVNRTPVLLKLSGGKILVHSTVSVRILITWCVPYCFSNDRDLLVYSTVSVRIGISWCVQYCVNKDRDLLVCTVLCQ